MKDRETIIDTLKHCAEEIPPYCRNCQYNQGSVQCMSELMRDALALIETAEENGEE